MVTTNEAGPLIHFKEQEYSNKLSRYTFCIVHIKTLMNTFNELNLEKIEFNEVPALLKNPVAFVYDKMAQGQPAFLAGMPINKEKAMEILIKPDGYEALLKKVEDYIKYSNANAEAKDIAENFEVNEKGEIVVKQKIVDSIKSDCEIRVESEYGQKVNELAIELVRILKDTRLDQALIKRPHREPEKEFKEFIQQVLLYDNKKGEFVINWQFLKDLDKRN